MSKHYLLLPAAVLCISMNGFSQTSVLFDPSVKYMYYSSLFPMYEYSGRTTPAVKKEKLNSVAAISDVAPDFWRNLRMPYNERIDLDRLIGVNYPKGYNHSYPTESDYMKVIDYVSVEVSAVHNGKVYSVKSIDSKLTSEQKNSLNAADQGTDINISIKFKYKNGLTDNAAGKIIKGELTVTVVPEKEAEYPGGFKKMTDYLNKNVITKISKTKASENLMEGTVKFTVDEQGRVMDVKIFSAPTDPQASKIVLDAMYNMPKWKPAETSKGVKVKQEFNIPLSNGGGC